MKRVLFRSSSWPLYLIAGGWLALFPLTGIVTLTVFLAALFIAQGVFEGLMAFRMRPAAGWLWMLIAAIAAFAVGVLIIAHLPSSAAWAIGLLVGIKLIMSGWAYLFLTMAATPDQSLLTSRSWLRGRSSWRDLEEVLRPAGLK